MSMSREVELHTHEWGDETAPPLLLVHGLTEAGTTWPTAVARWQDDWHVVAVDLRGHGYSPSFADEDLPRAPEVLLADVVEVLEALGRPTALVGHSLGGLLSLRAAMARPDLVRGLVLEDPAKPSGDLKPQLRFVAEQEHFLDIFDEPGDREEEKQRMRRESSWHEDEIVAWADCKALVDRNYIREGLFLGDAAWEELFAELTVPTLVVGPLDGEMLPDPELVANPLVRVEQVSGVGHCVRRDDPEAYHALVDPFLAGLA